MEMLGQRSVKPFLQRLEIGKQFEERVSSFMTSLGFPIGLNFSAKGQWEFGESAAHVEIKLDNRFVETGNLFIETKERRDESGISQWRPAGIYDASEPWFYLIGGPSKLWLLSVRWLRILNAEKQFSAWTKVTPTAEGFVIPTKLADQIAIRVWTDWT